MLADIEAEREAGSPHERSLVYNNDTLTFTRAAYIYSNSSVSHVFWKRTQGETGRTCRFSAERLENISANHRTTVFTHPSSFT